MAVYTMALSFLGINLLQAVALSVLAIVVLTFFIIMITLVLKTIRAHMWNRAGYCDPRVESKKLKTTDDDDIVEDLLDG